MKILIILSIWFVLAFIGYAIVRVGNRKKSPKPGYHDGFWNGEHALFRVIVAVVGDEPEELTEHFKKHRPDSKRYLWFTPFIGETRQVVEVVYSGEPFYLDNADGTGLYKVTKGNGSPGCYHASVYPSEILHVVPEEHWQHTNESLRQIVRDEVNERWMGIDPEGYSEHKERMKALEEGLKKHLESIRNAN